MLLFAPELKNRLHEILDQLFARVTPLLRSGTANTKDAKEINVHGVGQDEAETLRVEHKNN